MLPRVPAVGAMRPAQPRAQRAPARAGAAARPDPPSTAAARADWISRRR
ncbi:hypothetical protein Ga0080574_TMP2243 [Salipiger abyssi]|uniref:Uncharacterized protein n=1 Tax=Salipiger abyssi TaxID=1250539 RepID=A0A1P8UT85_9RHOB|nr:hypothetical protein Ga0080574_TMP2243 [Salipiger abyssi]